MAACIFNKAEKQAAINYITKEIVTRTEDPSIKEYGIKPVELIQDIYNDLTINRKRSDVTAYQVVQLVPAIMRILHGKLPIEQAEKIVVDDDLEKKISKDEGYDILIEILQSKKDDIFDSTLKEAIIDAKTNTSVLYRAGEEDYLTESEVTTQPIGVFSTGGTQIQSDEFKYQVLARLGELFVQYPNMDIPNVNGGVRATIMLAKDFPQDFLTEEYKNNPDVPIVAITDIDGNFLNFDESYNVTTKEGTLVYFPVREPSENKAETIDRITKIFMQEQGLTKKAATEEATKHYNQEVQQYKDILEYLNVKPGSKLINSITEISRGKLYQDPVPTKHYLNTVTEPLTFSIPYNSSGKIFTNVSNIDSPLEIYMEGLSEQKVEAIIALLTEDVYVYDRNNNKRKLNQYDINQLLESFIQSGKSSVDYKERTIDKDGRTTKITIANVEYDLTDNKEAAKEILRIVLSKSYVDNRSLYDKILQNERVSQAIKEGMSPNQAVYRYTMTNPVFKEFSRSKGEPSTVGELTLSDEKIKGLEEKGFYLERDPAQVAKINLGINNTFVEAGIVIINGNKYTAQKIDKGTIRITPYIGTGLYYHPINKTWHGIVKQKVNAVKSLIDQGGIIDDFSIDMIDNEIILRSNKKSYNDIIRENSYTYATPNKEGKFISLNGFIKYQLTPNSKEEIESTLNKETKEERFVLTAEEINAVNAINLEAKKELTPKKKEKKEKKNDILDINLNFNDIMEGVETLNFLVAEFVKRQNNASFTKKFTGTLLKTKNGLHLAYKKAYETIGENLKMDLEELKKYEGRTLTDEEVSLYNTLKYRVHVLGTIYNNYSDTPDNYTASARNTFVGYHINKSSFLSYEEKLGLQDDTEAVTKFDKGANEQSVQSAASPDTKYLLRGLVQFDDKGKVALNRLGFPKLLPLDDSFYYLSILLEDSLSGTDMYRRLINIKDQTTPQGNIARQLLGLLGSPNTYNDFEQRLWTGFISDFDKIRLAIRTTLISFDNGVPSFQTQISTIQDRRIFSALNNIFETARNNKYLIQNKMSQSNILNSVALLEDFFEEFEDQYKNKTYILSKRGIAAMKADPYTFLQNFGIYLSDTDSIRKALLKEVNKPDSFNHITILANAFVKNYRKALKENKQISSLGQLFSNYTSTKDYFIDLQIKYGNVSKSLMTSTAMDSPAYLHNDKSTFANMILGLKAVRYYHELLDHPHLEHMHVSKNPTTGHNAIIHAMFDFNNGGVKRKDADLIFELFGGLQLREGSNRKFIKGIEAYHAEELDRWFSDFENFMYKGIGTTFQHADKKTTPMVYISRLFSDPLHVNASKKAVNFVKDTVSNKSYVSPLRFRTKANSQLHWTKLVSKLMIEKVHDELNRVNIMRSVPEESRINDEEYNSYISGLSSSYGEIGSEFQNLRDMLTNEVMEGLYAIPANSLKDNSLEEYLVKNNPQLLAALETSIIEYFDVLSNNFVSTFHKIIPKNSFNNFLTKSAKDKVSFEVFKAAGMSEAFNPGINVTDAIIKAFWVNQFIHNYEMGSLFYGDAAQYNMDKDEFIKRDAGIMSHGLFPRFDKPFHEYVNSKKIFEHYIESAAINVDMDKIQSDYSFNGIWNSAILSEPVVKSIYIDDFHKHYIAYLKKEQPGKTEEEYKKLAKKKFKEYDKMKEADGQGWITLPAYKILSMAIGNKWSSEQEDLYQRILKGEDVDTDKVLKFFPVKKMQYWGPLKTKGLSKWAMHKFSLMPLLPNVIKDTNLKNLHNRMIEQNIHYATVQSGSKIMNISSNFREADLLYKDINKRITHFEDADYQFTPNRVFSQYFKEQVATSAEYKGKVTFSTQLKKLAQIGLYNGGVPSDYKPEVTDPTERQKLIPEFNALSAAEKNKYPNYVLSVKYLGIIRKMVAQLKADFRKKYGINEDNTLKEGNIQNLLDKIKDSLNEREIAELELKDIALKTTADGKTKIKYDLSLSVNANAIERILMALVEKQIVKPKLFGEALVMASTSLFEKPGKLRLPTDEEKAMMGTDDLPFYQEGTVDLNEKYAKASNEQLQEAYNELDRLEDAAKYWMESPQYARKVEMEYLEARLAGKSPKKTIIPGPTSAMKVKIAISEQFKPLLSLSSVKRLAKEKEITPLAALNILIKDKAWLDKNDHRAMITMVGVRIPVQGSNSMEFMEVYEFLPESMGNIIVLPSEIVAKSGGDFDIDKLTVLQPIIRRYGNQVKRVSHKTTEVTKAELSAIKKELISKKNVLVKKKNSGKKLTKVEFANLKRINRELADIKYKLDSGSVAGYQNKLMSTLRLIMERPDNYLSLVLPNDTAILKSAAIGDGPDGIALEDFTRDYDPKKVFRLENHKNVKRDKDGNIIGNRLESGTAHTNIYTPEFNSNKRIWNSKAGQGLSIGAVENTIHVAYTLLGVHLNLYRVSQSGKTLYRQTLAVPHNSVEYTQEIPNIIKKGNKTVVKGTRTVTGKAVSLASLDSLNKYYDINDLISQAINGWVDVAKDSWIFDIQGNKAVAPTLLFLIQAGVDPFQAIYWASQPLVIEYIKMVTLASSVRGDLFDMSSTSNYWEINNKARNKMFQQYPELMKSYLDASGYEPNRDTGEYGDWQFDLAGEAAVNSGVANDLMVPKLLQNIKAKRNGTWKPTDADVKVLLHFMQVEDMANNMSKIRNRVQGFDTKKSNTFSDISYREYALEKLEEKTTIPEKFLEALLTGTAVSYYHLTGEDDPTQMFKNIMPFRTDDVVLRYMNTNLFSSDYTTAEAEIDSTYFLSRDGVKTAFQADLPFFMFQNIRNIYVTQDTKFKNFEVIKDPKLSVPILFEQGKMIVNEKLLKDQYTALERDRVKNPTKQYEYTWLDPKIIPSGFYYQYKAFVANRELLRYEYSNDDSYKDDYAYKQILAIQPNEQKAFEIFIGDKALNNSRNFGYMFYSDKAYAMRFEEIKTKFPELDWSLHANTGFNIISDLKRVSKGLNDNDPFPQHNLILQDHDISQEQLDNYHKELLKLADPDVVKVKDPSANKYISDFFKDFSIYCFMQSRQNTTGRYSISRLITDRESIMDELSTSMAFFKKYLNNGVLDIYKEKFMLTNANSRWGVKDLARNYNLTTGAADRMIGKIAPRVTPVTVPVVQEAIDPVPTPVTEDQIISKSDIIALNELLKTKEPGFVPKQILPNRVTFNQFYNPITKRQESVPAGAKWLLQDNGLYDLIKEDGTVLITSINIKTGKVGIHSNESQPFQKTEKSIIKQLNEAAQALVNLREEITPYKVGDNIEVHFHSNDNESTLELKKITKIANNKFKVVIGSTGKDYSYIVDNEGFGDKIDFLTKGMFEVTEEIITKKKNIEDKALQLWNSYLKNPAKESAQGEIPIFIISPIPEKISISRMDINDERQEPVNEIGYKVIIPGHENTQFYLIESTGKIEDLKTGFGIALDNFEKGLQASIEKLNKTGDKTSLEKIGFNVNKLYKPNTGFKQVSGRALGSGGILTQMSEADLNDLESTVGYYMLEDEQNDLSLYGKGGQVYTYLQGNDASLFEYNTKINGGYPKSFMITKNITKYEKIGDTLEYNPYNTSEKLYYEKANNNKKSNLYNIRTEDGEVIAEKVRVLTKVEDAKMKISDLYGLNMTSTKVYNANRSVAFTLYREKPSKAKYIAQAKKYLYSAIKFVHPDEGTTKINLDNIEKFLDAFPEGMWDYINTTYSPEDSTNVNAAIRMQNRIKFKLPKLGFIKELEKITGIPLNDVMFLNKDRSGTIEKKLGISWNDPVVISSDLTTRQLHIAIRYYLKQKGYLKPSSEEQNVRKYAEHRGIDYERLRELVFGDFDNALEDIKYNMTGNSDTIELSKWRNAIRNYDWQSVELFSKPYEDFDKYAAERATKKFKDKTLSNGISHLDYFFSGNFNWLNINFNNISGQYFASDMERPADVGLEEKILGFANPFVQVTYKKPIPGKHFLKDTEIFNRLAAILHEPFHALHALSYGSKEEVELREAFNKLYHTEFGKNMMEKVFGSTYNNQDISQDTLYKEFAAFSAQLMLYPKEWIQSTDLRSNDIYEYIEKIQTLQDKTYTSIINRQEKIGTIEKPVTEEEAIKLTFLEKLYNYVVSALNKVIPLSKAFLKLIPDTKLVTKTKIEDVFGSIDEKVTHTVALPDEIKQAKKEFLDAMDEFKSAINTLMKIDEQAFSSDNIARFFSEENFERFSENSNFTQEEIDNLPPSCGI